MLAEGLRSAVKGLITLRMLQDNWAGLFRHICDSPRRRKRRQLADLDTLQRTLKKLS